MKTLLIRDAKHVIQSALSAHQVQQTALSVGQAPHKDTYWQTTASCQRTLLMIDMELSSYQEILELSCAMQQNVESV